MKRFTILMAVAAVSIMAHPAFASPFSTIRQSPGSPFNGFLYTGFGWRTHACWWSHHYIPNRSGFMNQGVYGRCQHGMVFVPTRPVRVPPGVFPGPYPPLPPTPVPPITPGTNQIPPRIIRQPTIPISSGLISMEASRIVSGSGSSRLPAPPLPSHR